MASDPSNVEPTNPERRLVTGFVEEIGADAVLVIWSTTKKRKTASRISSWGNHFAVKGMLEWAYEMVIGFDSEFIDSGEDDDEEEDDE